MTPLNPEAVLAGPKSCRPKVTTLNATLTAEHFETVRLVPGKEPYAVQRRAAPAGSGLKRKRAPSGCMRKDRGADNVGTSCSSFRVNKNRKPAKKCKCRRSC